METHLFQTLQFGKLVLCNSAVCSSGASLLIFKINVVTEDNWGENDVKYPGAGAPWP